MPRPDRLPRAAERVVWASRRLAWALHRARPRLKFGVALLWEPMRYDALTETTGDPFKCNNDWRSRYARLLVEKRPELAGWITMRELRA